MILPEELDFETINPHLVASFAAERGEVLAFWLEQLSEKAERAKARQFLMENWESVKLVGPEKGWRERSWLGLNLAIEAIETESSPKVVLKFLGDAYRYALDSTDTELRLNQFWRWMRYYLTRYRLDKSSVELMRGFLKKADFQSLLQNLIYRSYLLRDAQSISYIKGLMGKKRSLRIRNELVLLDRFFRSPEGKWISRLDRKDVSTMKRVVKAMLPEMTTLGLVEQYGSFLFYTWKKLKESKRLSNTELIASLEERLYDLRKGKKLEAKYFRQQPTVFLGAAVLSPRAVDVWPFKLKKVHTYSPAKRILIAPTDEFGKWKVL